MDNFLDLDEILEFQANLQNQPDDNPDIKPEGGEGTPPQKTDTPDTDPTDEPEPTEPTPPTPPTPPSKEAGNTSQDNVLEKYYDFLKEQELLLVDDDFKFDGTEESLNEAKVKTLNAYKQKAIEELADALPEKFKQVLSYGLNGGKDPMDVLQNSDPLEVDLSVQENQIKIIRQHLKETTSYNDEKIERQIQRFIKAEELEQEAYDALDELKEIREEKEQSSIKAQQEALKNKEEADKAFRTNIAQVINTTDSIPAERKLKVQAFMFNPIKKGTEVLTDYQRNMREISKNPQHLVQLADLLFDYNSKTGFNLERFQKQGASKANQTLKERLESKMTTGKSNTSHSPAKPEFQSVDWNEIFGR